MFWIHDQLEKINGLMRNFTEKSMKQKTLQSKSNDDENFLNNLVRHAENLMLRLKPWAVRTITHVFIKVVEAVISSWKWPVVIFKKF